MPILLCPETSVVHFLIHPAYQLSLLFPTQEEVTMRFSKKQQLDADLVSVQCPRLSSSLVLLLPCYKVSHNLAHKTSNSEAALNFLLLGFTCPLSCAGLGH